MCYYVQCYIYVLDYVAQVTTLKLLFLLPLYLLLIVYWVGGFLFNHAQVTRGVYDYSRGFIPNSPLLPPQGDA